jgi:hypothetical protein
MSAGALTVGSGCLLRVIRAQVEPAASPAMSAIPPKAELNINGPANQKPKSGKLEYCQKLNQRCSSGRSLFFTDD